MGSDVRIRCLVKSDVNSTGINAFRWNYKKGKHKTSKTIEIPITVGYYYLRHFTLGNISNSHISLFSDSTVTGVDTSNLLILGLEPGDSKNYTCIPYTGAIRNSKYSTSYTHYVVG